MMCAAAMSLAAWEVPIAAEHVFRSGWATATRREHAAAALGAKCSDFSIL